MAAARTQRAVRGRGNGYDFLHVAVDDHSRLAYIEALADERDSTCAGFLHRAATWFHQQGVTVERILTDNALAYRRGRTWAAVCVGLGIRRRFIKPGCPWTNGKAERLAALDAWVENDNTHRAHSALGGQPPITRLAC